ncbi:hypothetical protein FB451DRAFT_1557450 [Mycena latifolia]|nr:hypothetical protein FB451DRAFT_1557450 [Mycena latifolia]
MASNVVPKGLEYVFTRQTLFDSQRRLRWRKLHAKRLAFSVVDHIRVFRNIPEYADHVKIVSIALTSHRPEDVYPAFAEMLNILPGLQTLQLVSAWAFPSDQDYAEPFFQPYSYPTVETLIVDKHFLSVINCVPNIRKLVYTGDFSDEDVLACVRRANKHCPSLSVLRGHEDVLWTVCAIPMLVNYLPGLREIPRLSTENMTADHMVTLTQLHDLQTIDIVFDPHFWDDDTGCKRHIQAIQAVLLTSFLNLKLFTVRSNDLFARQPISPLHLL